MINSTLKSRKFLKTRNIDASLRYSTGPLYVQIIPSLKIIRVVSTLEHKDTTQQFITFAQRVWGFNQNDVTVVSDYVSDIKYSMPILNNFLTYSIFYKIKKQHTTIKFLGNVDECGVTTA